jgi:hypothetical protein
MKQIIENNGYKAEWFKPNDWSVFSKFKNLIKTTEYKSTRLKYQFIFYSYFVLLAIAIVSFFFAGY